MRLSARRICSLGLNRATSTAWQRAATSVRRRKPTWISAVPPPTSSLPMPAPSSLTWANAPGTSRTAAISQATRAWRAIARQLRPSPRCFRSSSLSSPCSSASPPPRVWSRRSARLLACTKRSAIRAGVFCPNTWTMRCGPAWWVACSATSSALWGYRCSCLRCSMICTHCPRCCFRTISCPRLSRWLCLPWAWWALRLSPAATKWPRRRLRSCVPRRRVPAHAFCLSASALFGAAWAS